MRNGFCLLLIAAGQINHDMITIWVSVTFHWAESTGNDKTPTFRFPDKFRCTQLLLAVPFGLNQSFEP